MFVDASAIVAMLAGEAEADALADLVETAQHRVTSPIAIFETVAALCRIRHVSVEEAHREVAVFLATAGIAIVDTTSQDLEAALSAFARYGKGRGHPAQLNMGDCFAYGAARSRNLSLLFTGRDFRTTDIRSARP
jgi:ribonuclease VapC